LQPEPILVALGPGRQAALAREEGVCSWQKCTAQEMPLILGFVTELKVLNPTLAPANARLTRRCGAAKRRKTGRRAADC